jgi:hypothetical protein
MSAQGRFICLAGVSGAGKDTVGGFLTTHQGFERVAIADPLKHTMMALFGLTAEQLWGDARNVPDPRLGRAPRELYQRFGQVCVELDPDVWLRPFRARVLELIQAGRDVVCTDLRTAAEWEAARKLGARIWLVRRPGAGAPGAMASDRTEREVAGLDPSRFDVIVENTGTMEELYSRVLTALAF